MNYKRHFLSIDIVGFYLPASAHLSVLVNGTEVKQVVTSHPDLSPYSADAMGRCAYYGYGMYDKQVVQFDSSLLQAGSNTITFRHAGIGHHNVMYDCVRLEIERSKRGRSG
jgi:hypothetical protein